MRILVYGAGVLGCELAHVLLQNKKNDVTLLARGEWKERIDQKGLVIRQWAQRKTTVDRVRTIDVLAPEDFYDLVFVVLQAGQLPDVLPVLSRSCLPVSHMQCQTTSASSFSVFSNVLFIPSGISSFKASYSKAFARIIFIKKR